MMHYSNTKIKVRSPDGHTDFFDIVAGVFQGDTLVPDLFIICLDDVLRTLIKIIEENDLTLKKASSRNYNDHRLYRWQSASCKYTNPSRIPAA